jgi:hypothetical protein
MPGQVDCPQTASSPKYSIEEYDVDSSFIDTYKKKSKQRGQDTKARRPERLILLSIGAKNNGW